MPLFRFNFNNRPARCYRCESIYKYTDKILKCQSIDVHNNGPLSRDFTYIDDIVDGIVGLVHKQPTSGVS